MSKKCKAFSELKLGLGPCDNRKAFYAGWQAALEWARTQQEPVAFYYKSGLVRAGYGIDIKDGTALYTHPAPAQPVLEPIEGDLLPAIGEKVLIHLASSDKWVSHRVTGYYVWGNHGENKNLHRVFVRVVDRDGYPNARLLGDVRRVGDQAQDAMLAKGAGQSADTLTFDMSKFQKSPRNGRYSVSIENAIRALSGELGSQVFVSRELGVPPAVVQQLVDAIQAAIDCGMVPLSSVADGGAAKHSIQVRVADQLRAALKAAKGE